MNEFVGYWGQGDRAELENLLTKVSSDGNMRVGNQTDSCIWGIGGSKVSESGTIATISAGGLGDDAWVTVEENCLILGREPFGRVPLYWTKQKQVIWFASRFQLLLAIASTPEVSIPALYGYSCFSYVPTPLTPVSGIFAVPAGVELIADIESLPITRSQYQWREAPVLIKEEVKAIAQLQTLLQQAVDRQIADLSSSTEVGVFLSGGLDSATVAALLVQAGIKVRAYSLDFGIEELSELPYAEKVAAHLSIPLVKVPANPTQIKKAITATAAALDLPFGDGVTVPLYLLCQRASQEVGIIFNGEGGDQLFAGWTNKPLIAAGVYNSLHPGGGENFTQQYLRTFHRLYGYEARVWQGDVYQQVKNINPQVWLDSALDANYCNSLLHRLRRATLMLKGAQNIHPRATNLALAWDFKVRSPFCDLPLGEWTFQLSGELCLQGACEKYLLKRAVESWLPGEIVWREKRGMGVPLTLWCLKELWPEVGKWLNPGMVRSGGRFVPDIAMKVIRGQLGGQIRGRRIGEILWLLMMWQVWRRQVLGEAATEKTLFSPFLLPSWWWKPPPEL
ncbi:MAG: asparagine synthase [Hormoscilla sp. GUM202]|nr:asparagine synthase [Hormoscilla sp. GUM202]